MWNCRSICPYLVRQQIIQEFGEVFGMEMLEGEEFQI
jgi:hypothetical protein